MEKLKTISMADLMKDYVPLPRPKDAPPLTLAQIISMEPSVAEILDALKPSRSDRIWYRQYIDAKNKVSKLVGWGAEQYALRTEQAYDVVMDIVIEKLEG